MTCSMAPRRGNVVEVSREDRLFFFSSYFIFSFFCCSCNLSLFFFSNHSSTSSNALLPPSFIIHLSQVTPHLLKGRPPFAFPYLPSIGRFMNQRHLEPGLNTTIDFNSSCSFNPSQPDGTVVSRQGKSN